MRRGKPLRRTGSLRRKAPLAPQTALERSSRLRSRGKGPKAVLADERRSQAYEAVDARTKQRLGWMGSELSRTPCRAPEKHHVAGRGSSAKLPLWLAEGPLMILNLLPEEHERITNGDLALRDKARWLALGFMLEAHPGLRNDVSDMCVADPLDALRWMASRLGERDE